MKKAMVPVAISVLMAAYAFAQAPAGTAANAVGQIAPGSLIPAELAKAVDAKKAKPGDPVQAKITQELLSKDGHAVIPLGSRVEGHVTEAKPHEKGESPSTLGIAFDKIVFKDGHELPMSATIQALAPPLMSFNPNGDSMAQPSAPGSAPSQPSGGMYGGMSHPAGGSPSENPGGSMGTPGAGNTGSTGTTPGAGGVGRLSNNAQGVIGIPGLAMQGDVLTAQKKNVKLDSGTQLMLRVGGRQ